MALSSTQIPADCGVVLVATRLRRGLLQGVLLFTSGVLCLLEIVCFHGKPSNGELWSWCDQERESYTTKNAWASTFPPFTEVVQRTMRPKTRKGVSLKTGFCVSALRKRKRHGHGFGADRISKCTHILVVIFHRKTSVDRSDGFVRASWECSCTTFLTLYSS